MNTDDNDIVALVSNSQDVPIGNGCVIAQMMRSNPCVFYPTFFSHRYVDSLKDWKIIPGITRDEDGRVRGRYQRHRKVQGGKADEADEAEHGGR